MVDLQGYVGVAILLDLHNAPFCVCKADLVIAIICPRVSVMSSDPTVLQTGLPGPPTPWPNPLPVAPVPLQTDAEWPWSHVVHRPQQDPTWQMSLANVRVTAQFPQ